MSPPNTTMQERRRSAAEDQDAVGEGEAVAPGGELAGEEAVAGQEGRQAREVGEGGVGGQHQDQHGRRLDAVVEQPRPPKIAARELRDHRLALGGHDVVGVRQQRDAQEHA